MTNSEDDETYEYENHPEANEIIEDLEIKLRVKKSEATAVEIKMNYEMKGKEGDLSSVAQIS